MARRPVGVCVRCAVIAALFVVLTACSGTTLVYNRLDTILPWYVDDYVDLDNPQQQLLDQTLQPFLRWHRQQELPRYVEVLNNVDANLGQPVTPREVGAIYADMEVAWLRLEQESLDWLLELGGTLSDEQVGEFLGYLQERQEEYEEEYLTRTEPEYREETYDSFRDSIEDFLGRLSPDQRARLKMASAELARSDAVWLGERAAWLQRLALMLQREPGWQQRVREALIGRADTLSPGYQQVFEHNLQVVFEAVADVLNSRTPKQDRSLRAKLADLRDDLQTLIAQGVAAPADAG